MKNFVIGCIICLIGSYIGLLPLKNKSKPWCAVAKNGKLLKFEYSEHYVVVVDSVSNMAIYAFSKDMEKEIK